MKIENGLISQTPTVVDLKVNPERVSVDTVWQNVKGQALTFGVTNQTNATIGRLLEIHGGDVLVQPQTCWVSERQGNGVKTHKLTVSGYIGKYENFRTATQEDIDLINLSKYGPRKRKESPVNPQTAIFVNSVATPVAKPLPNAKPKLEMGSVVAKAVVTKAEKPEPKKVYNRKTGTKVILGVDTFQEYYQYFYTNNYSYRGSWYSTTALSAIIGKQNKHWFWGVGASYRFDRNINYSSGINPDFKSYSLFLQGRRYFWKRMFAPYFDMRLGAEYVNMAESSTFRDRGYDDVSAKIDLGVGLSLGAFAIGVEFDMASVFIQSGYPLGEWYSPALHLSLKF